MRDGDDYPYFTTAGFPAEFVSLEMSLCARDGEGRVRRDAAGQAIMECLCGDVVCGRLPSSEEFVTQRGSFWTNSTTSLQATIGKLDRQTRIRNRCNAAGYESVALVTLRIGEERLGLLQLNDHGAGRFAVQDIVFWERLADQLAVAISKLRLEDQLRQSQDRFSSLFDAMTEGVALHELVYDNGRAVDYRIVEVNPSFEAQTGLSASEARGRLASELYGSGAAPYLAEYARVAEGGGTYSSRPISNQWRAIFASRSSHLQRGASPPSSRTSPGAIMPTRLCAPASSVCAASTKPDWWA